MVSLQLQRLSGSASDLQDCVLHYKFQILQIESLVFIMNHMYQNALRSVQSEWSFSVQVQSALQQLTSSSMSNASFHYLFKFIVIGDTGVGKSCVVQQFVEQKINSEHDVTIGVEFAAKTIKINKKIIKLQIWDTAGQENFRSITRSYYRSAIGAFLVYDITRRETFQHLQEWLQEVKANGNAAMQVLLVGNKTDLESERQVSTQQGRNFAKKEGLNFIEISAKDYKKVQGAFNTLAENVLNLIENGEISEQTVGIKVSDDLKIDPLGGDLQKGRLKRCC